MGGPYLVGPPKGTDWKLDRDRFAQALCERWPTADIGGGPVGEPIHLIWSIRFYDEDGGTTGPYLDGTLDPAYQAFSLYGTPSLAAEFVVWVRKFAPDQQLVLLADNDRPTFPVLPITTVEEVIDFIS